MQGATYQVDKAPLLNIPIVIPDKKIENIFIECCDKIYKIREYEKNADISEIEQFIDDIVYSAYGLTKDDVLTVESTIEEWENMNK